jgi:hypothetical protein
MVIAANDYIAVDRRDTTGNVGTYGAIQAYGTTANTSNVTQLTSRTTGVTINAPVGTITLFSVLNSAADSTFTVTNSFVDAGDVVLVTQKSGTDPRRIAVTATAAGSFAVTSASISGTTTEAPVYNFTVIKAALV